MNGQFKVGEVLFGQNFVRDIEFNGMACVVLKPRTKREWFDLRQARPVWGYMCEVEWASGESTLVEEDNLRRKQPPAGEQSVMDMFKLPAPRVAETA